MKLAYLGIIILFLTGMLEVAEIGALYVSSGWMKSFDIETFSPSFTRGDGFLSLVWILLIAGIVVALIGIRYKIRLNFKVEKESEIVERMK